MDGSHDRSSPLSRRRIKTKIVINPPLLSSKRNCVIARVPWRGGDSGKDLYNLIGREGVDFFRKRKLLSKKYTIPMIFR